MKRQLRLNEDVVFRYALGIAFLLAVWLRVYLVSDQVLIDDEWQGFYYVLGQSPGWLLTHFSIPGATCIPLNLYTWILGATVGWSENLLRLPSLAAGILCVVVGSALARPLIGNRRAALLALLLAVSPILIFYSRNARPYSAVAFLAFASLLLAARWMQSGDGRLGLLFAGACVLAGYFHLFAVITVAAPFLVVCLRYAYRRFRHSTPTPGTAEPRLKHWAIAGMAVAAGSALLIAPALLHSLHSTFFNVALKGTFDSQSLPRVAALISGSGQTALAVVFWAATVVGMVEQTRRNPWFGCMLLLLYPLHALALLASRPDAAQSAIVVTRYCIPLVPVSILFAACGIERVVEAVAARTKLKPIIQTTFAAAFVLALAVSGPLAQTYVAPNNFTGHGAFQHRYGPIDWSRSFYSDIAPKDFPLITTIRIDEVSPFYRFLAEHPSSRPVVEYPMFIGDHFNPLYYYQHFHHRPVIVGYASNVTLAKGLAAGNIFGSTYVDQVMTLIPKAARVRFQNLVSMDDIAAMRARGAEYVILHKAFEAQLRGVADSSPELERLWVEYQKQLGPPVYSNELIFVFRL